MPANLTANWSPAEFTDLIGYLETLHTGRRPSPGEGIARAVMLPDGFVVNTLVDGLTGCTAMEVVPMVVFLFANKPDRYALSKTIACSTIRS